MADLARIYADPLIERFLVMPLPWSGTARERFVWLQEPPLAGRQPPLGGGGADGALVGSMALTKSFPYGADHHLRDRAVGAGPRDRAAGDPRRRAVRLREPGRQAHRVGRDRRQPRLAPRGDPHRIHRRGHRPQRRPASAATRATAGWAACSRGTCAPPRTCPSTTRSSRARPGSSWPIGRSWRPARPGCGCGRSSEEDLDDLAATCADELTQQWVSLPRNYTRASADRWFGKCRERWDRGESVLFVLADGADRYCGSVELMLGEPGEAELGYCCSPWARGRGWMTAAARRLCELGFAELGLERIVWRAVVGNEASRRVAEKVGFTVEGAAGGSGTATTAAATRGSGASSRRIWLSPGDIPEDLGQPRVDRARGRRCRPGPELQAEAEGPAAVRGWPSSRTVDVTVPSLLV